MKVVLADPRYLSSGSLTIDTMPLGLGFLKSVMDRDLPEVDSIIHTYPDQLLNELKSAPVDALLLTNYQWSENLSYSFARIFKQINPNGFVVMGGPNIPIEEEFRINFLKEKPEIDAYLLGESDFTATALLQLYFEANRRFEHIDFDLLPSGVYRVSDAYFVKNNPPRIRTLDEIPSPYLTGVLDPFFDGTLVPLMETNRGCPFQCTFCVQGTDYFKRIKQFPLDRVKEEIDYVGRMIFEKTPQIGLLRIADSNFGMYKRDVEIAESIALTQEKYNWPTYIDATTGKNNADNIIRSMEKVNGALIMYRAVQSLDEQVLDNIKRSNISLDTYKEIQMYVRGRGLKSSSDLILCLPGETLGTHLEAIKTLIDSGTSNLNNFQTIVLKGSELETRESRAKYEYQTKYRLIPRAFEEIDDEIVFDFEEIVVSTDRISFEEYLEARKYHFAVSIFWNSGRFDLLTKICNMYGCKNSDWLVSVLDELEKQNNPAAPLFKNYMHETRDELFDSVEEGRAFYSQPEQLKHLKEHRIGGNLIYSYRAMGNFYYWPECCKTAINAARALFSQNKEHPAINSNFWNDLYLYFLNGFVHGKTKSEILKSGEVSFNYDLPNLAKTIDNSRLEDHFKSQKISYLHKVPEANYDALSAALEHWNTEVQGLQMMVRSIRKDLLNKTMISLN